ncbi:hypothetical protein PENTCL1PPCAC_30379 [Pristionchus entomophagus]|uniref:RING-type domain-containing protein n=1 Tax=Pristionchus entomophagus TaxID=358040 RepID=A0AAV5UQZ7_9BILA|nr:hypothetical protein PENTCL1PPCAC_30379 [Pristionchus entomophagus]
MKQMDGSLLSLMVVDDHCVMMTPLDRISDEKTTYTFAILPIKITKFPRVKIIGLKISDDISYLKERRIIRREVDPDDQDTMRYQLKPRGTIEDRERDSSGYGNIHVRRRREEYLIKVEVNQTRSELSFEGHPSLRYHLAFECDKGSIMLMGVRDLTIHLSGTILGERPACVICHISKVECEVFSCGHFSCRDCIVDVYKACKNCPICKKDWKGSRDKTERGFVYDTHCRKDGCMMLNRLNLPCRCITCDKDTKNCTRCLTLIKSFIPFYY